MKKRGLNFMAVFFGAKNKTRSYRTGFDAKKFFLARKFMALAHSAGYIFEGVYSPLLP